MNKLRSVSKSEEVRARTNVSLRLMIKSICESYHVRLGTCIVLIILILCSGLGFTEYSISKFNKSETMVHILAHF